MSAVAPMPAPGARTAAARAACGLLAATVDPDDPLQRLHRFLADGAFATRGAFWTDLDGTLVHEEAGRIFISSEVELGLARIREHGRPVIANTLRFPLSVIRVLRPVSSE